MTSHHRTMFGIRELRPGPRWRQLFDITWPAYRRWYLSEGAEARPTLTDAAAALAQHMPELLPTWAQLSEQTGFDELATTMLTQWNLPRFAPAACSQVITLDRSPALMRNYDYHPDLFEWVSMSTDYLQPVIGTGDCLWGLLDGVNAAGLTISLTFGGERRAGEGFGIPLVVRYLLETCTGVEEARSRLRQLPVAMSYNLTMLDSSGAFLTAHLRPGHPAEFRPRPLATNHRWDDPLDPAHAARYRSVERADRLDGLLAERSSAEQITAELLRPPLHASAYDQGFGTLYTAAYRPVDRRVTYRWPGRTWERGLDSPDDSIDVELR
jgi:predicted choloylglycine hydrolase